MKNIKEEVGSKLSYLGIFYLFDTVKLNREELDKVMFKFKKIENSLDSVEAKLGNNKYYHELEQNLRKV